MSTEHDEPLAHLHGRAGRGQVLPLEIRTVPPGAVPEVEQVHVGAVAEHDHLPTVLGVLDQAAGVATQSGRNVGQLGQPLSAAPVQHVDPAAAAAAQHHHLRRVDGQLAVARQGEWKVGSAVAAESSPSSPLPRLRRVGGVLRVPPTSHEPRLAVHQAGGWGSTRRLQRADRHPLAVPVEVLEALAGGALKALAAADRGPAVHHGPDAPGHRNRVVGKRRRAVLGRVVASQVDHLHSVQQVVVVASDHQYFGVIWKESIISF